MEKDKSVKKTQMGEKNLFAVLKCEKKERKRYEKFEQKIKSVKKKTK